MKKVSFTRSGLTVSVSLAALCVAMPALANQTTTTSPGDDLAPVYTVTADEVVALSHGNADPELDKIVRAAFDVMGGGSSRLNFKEVLDGLNDKDWRREKGASPRL